MTKCLACEKTYNIDINEHYNRNPTCENWVNMLNGKDYYAKSIQKLLKSSKDIYSNTCDICSKSYKSRNSFLKHCREHPECKKTKWYNEIKKGAHCESDHDGVRWMDFEESMHNNNNEHPINFSYSNKAEKQFSLCEKINKTQSVKLHNIIWNIYLTDKSYINDLKDGININNIKYLICILPNKTSISINREIVDEMNGNIDYLYYGNNHSSIISNKTLYQFNKCYDKLQKNKQNTLILCNAGYQRSIPFICYYLLNRYSDEIPCLEKAVELCLTKINKQNVNIMKDLTVSTLRKLMDEELNPIFS